MKEHVSFSEMGLWDLCQYRWMRDYLEGRRIKNYGVHMDFGTCIHGTIEKVKRRKITEVVEPLSFFELSFRKLYDENKLKYGERDLKSPIEFFIEAGKNILNRLNECEELASAEVVWNEYPLLEPIERTDGVQIKFKGFIDMVIKTKDKRGNTILYVCDFKTCSWGWGPDKRQDLNLHAQLMLYKHFLCKKFNLDPKLVRVAFVLLKKRPPKNGPPVEWFPVSAGPISVDRAVNAMNSRISEMVLREKDMSYIKNRKSCVNDYGEKCPFLDTELCTK